MKFKTQFTNRFRELLSRFQAISEVPDTDQSEVSIQKDITPVVYVPSRYELTFKDIMRLNLSATPAGTGTLWYDTGLSVQHGECWKIISCVATKDNTANMVISTVAVAESADTGSIVGGGNQSSGIGAKDILHTIWMPDGAALFVGADVTTYVSGDVVWHLTIERYTYEQNNVWGPV